MNVLCIKCWNADAVMKLLLDGSNEFECGECSECGEMFTCEEVRAVVEGAKKWEKVLKWIDAAPVEAEDATV